MLHSTYLPIINYSANQMSTTQAKAQTPLERRANCNPVLIGVLTGAVAFVKKNEARENSR